MINFLNPKSMKTMKKIVALSTAILFAFSLNVFSQDKKAKDNESKMHIKIEVDKDGKTTKIDTTINPEDLAALNEHLADMDIHIGSPESSDFPGVQSFSFGEGGKELEEHMRELAGQLKDKEINMEEFEKQMEKMQENMKDNQNMYMYKFKTDGDSDNDSQLLELEKELDHLDNMNFNFNDDGKTKTIVIDGDDIKIDCNKNKGDKGDNQIIIKKKSSDGKDKKHQETKKVIIMMKSSMSPEKQKAEFAAEPAKDENNSADDAARVRYVDKKKNSWLNDLSCYPNPSSGAFTLSFRLNNPEPAELKIMDIAGREVLAENIPENSEWVEKQIKLPSNSSAAYLLILRQGNNWYHEKIFVKS